VGGGGATGACVPDLPPDGSIASSTGSGGSGSGSSSGGDDGGGTSSSSGAIPPGCGDGYIDLAAGEQCDPGTQGSGVSGCNPNCTIQCSADAGFLWPKNNHCYELAGTATSLYIGADRNVCAPLAGAPHVATFASEEEFRAVAASVKAGWFWVGLLEPMNNNDYVSYGEFEPGWSMQCSGCYAHTADLTMGLPKSTVVGTGGDYCVQASSDLKQNSWQMVPCGGLNAGLPVVCEREPVGNQWRACDAGTCIELVWTHGAKSYVYSAFSVTADQAEAACRGMGGSLVVLRSRDEREQLWKELGKLTSGVPPKIWIGLSETVVDAGASDATPADGAATSVWRWDDDASDDAYASPWGWDQPKTTANRSSRAYLMNEQPAASDNTLARTDGPMPAALPYVCEVPP
jgi:hypothetical protein